MKKKYKRKLSKIFESPSKNKKRKMNKKPYKKKKVQPKPTETRVRVVTLENYRKIAKHAINKMLEQKRSNNIFVFDKTTGMLFYAWTSKPIYRPISVLEFMSMVSSRVSSCTLKALEISIESGTFFEIIQSTRIPQVEIDKPFLVPINTRVGAIDLKKCFLNRKKPRYAKRIKIKKAHLTFNLDTEFVISKEPVKDVYKHYDPSTIRKAIMDVYSEKGIKSLIQYFSFDKETKNYNAEFLDAIMNGVFNLWEEKGFFRNSSK